MSAITLAEYKLCRIVWFASGLKIVKQRLQDEYANDPEQREKRYQQLLENSGKADAIETGAANAQHYEVPAAFISMPG